MESSTKKNFERFLLGSALFFFLFAVASVLRFLWSGHLVEEFHSDMAEIVLWAQASLESGSILNPDFNYSYTIPFGGHLLFVPLISLFGVGLKTFRIGMALIFFVFAALFYGIFRSFHWKRYESLFSAGFLVLSCSATKKLREIFWGHVIHYSLAVFFLLLALILWNLYSRCTDRKRFMLWALLCLVAFFGSANGPTMVLFFSLVLLGTCWLDVFLSEGLGFIKNRRALCPPLYLSLSAALGVLCNQWLTKGFVSVYSEAYSKLQPSEAWVENALRVPSHWISLFMELPSNPISVFSFSGIQTAVGIFCALFTVILTYTFLRSESDAYERRVKIIQMLMTLVTLFFYIFGSISDKNWRLVPLLFTSLLCVLMLFRRVTRGLILDRVMKPRRILTLVGLLLFALNTFFHGFELLSHNPDTSVWFQEGGVLSTLKAHQLTYGYTTDYWFGNSITLLSGESIRVRQVGLDENGLNTLPIQVNRHWFADQPDQDRYFLLLFEKELTAHPELADQAVEIWRCSNERTYDTWHTHEAGFVILVYDFNIMEGNETNHENFAGKNS